MTQPYYLNGERVPSVTTIIGKNLGWNKDALIGWTRKMALAGTDPNDIKNRAAKTGTLAHQMVEMLEFPEKHIVIDRNEWEDEDWERAKSAFNAYVNWKVGHRVQVLQGEIPLVSKRHGFGGTIDMIAMVDGQKTLLDWKTSNGVYLEYRIQLGGYSILWEEYDKEVNWDIPAKLIRLSKDDASFEVHDYPNLDLERDIFLLLLDLDKKRKLLERVPWL